MSKHKTEKKKENPEGEMSLSGHLRELRNRILVCVLLFLVATLVGLRYAPDLTGAFLDAARECNYQFVYIAPQELMLQYFFIAILFGICITVPMLLYQAWAFVRPGLRKGENAMFLTAMIFGLLCFCGGAFFAFRIMIPFMLVFFETLSVDTQVSAYISVASYLSFLLTVLVVFGLVFELPVVSVILNRMGLLRVQWMKKGRRVVIVVIFVVAALITPPDIVSQSMVALPMIVLYEISIILCTVCQKVFGESKRKASEEEEDQAMG